MNYLRLMDFEPNSKKIFFKILFQVVIHATIICTLIKLIQR